MQGSADASPIINCKIPNLQSVTSLSANCNTQKVMRLIIELKSLTRSFEDINVILMNLKASKTIATQTSPLMFQITET